MGNALVPFGGVTEYRRPQRPVENPGEILGIHISVHPDALHAISEKIANWFHGRDEVDVVDVGVSDKVGIGYIIMEWLEYDIDPLFLAILRDEEAIADYAVYEREVL